MSGRISEVIRWCRQNPPLARRGAVGLVIVAAVSSLLTILLAHWFDFGPATDRLAAELQKTRRELAEHAESRENLERALLRSLLSEIRAVRVLHLPGWRWYAIEKIREATRLQFAAPDPVVLRDSAVAAMLEPDVLSLANLGTLPERVRSVTISPDGERLAAAGADGSIRVWHLVSHNVIRNIEATSPAASLRFDPRGSTLAAACDDGVVRLWSTDQTEQPRELRGDVDRLTVMAYSPDGAMLAAGAEDGSVLVWAAGSGEPIARWRCFASVTALAWDPDGQWLAAGSADPTIRLWDVKSGQEREPCVGHTAGITALAARGDGAWITSAANDGTIRVWGACGSTPLASWSSSGGPPQSLALLPYTDSAVIGTQDGGLRLIDLVTGDERLLAKQHTGPINDGALSGDGTLLASGSADTTVRLYAAVAGVERQRYRGHYGDVLALDFSPDLAAPGLLASASSDATAAVFPMSGHLADLSLAQDTVLAAAFSPDNKQVAVGSKEHRVTVVWDLASRQPVRLLWGHRGPVLSVAWSGDGRTIASGSEDGTVRLWDAASGTPGPVLRAHQGPVNSVAFSPDSHWLASGSFDGTVRLWSLPAADPENTPVTVGSHNGYVLSVAWRPDGRMIASASADHKIKIWEFPGKPRSSSAAAEAAELGNPRLAAELLGHTSHVFSVAFSPDGGWIVSGSNDRTMRLWDVAARRLKATVPAHTTKLLAVAFDPRGEFVASAAEDGSVRIWELRGIKTEADSAKPVRSGPRGKAPAVELCANIDSHFAGVPALQFSSDGHYLLTGSWDHTLRLWNLRSDRPADPADGGTPGLVDAFARTGEPVPSPQPALSFAGRAAVPISDRRPRVPTRIGNGVVLSMALSPDGKRLAAATKEPCAVAVWDLGSRSMQRVLWGHTDDVMSVAWSPDGRWLASGSQDATVRLWDADSGEQLAVLRDHTAKVNTVTIAPDGRTLASGSFDGTIRLWGVSYEEDAAIASPANRRQPEGAARSAIKLRVRALGNIDGRSNWVLGLAFSPDGGKLASASADGIVRLWTLARSSDGSSVSATAAGRYEGHAGFVYSAAFSPDGQHIASAGDDSTVRIWNTESGECEHVAIGHSARVYSVAFSPDGRHVASAGFDREVRLWNARHGREVNVLAGHALAVPTLAFGPGELLLTGSWDRTIRLWNRSTGELDAMLGEPGTISSLAFLASGDELTIVSANGAAYNTALRSSMTPSEGIVAASSATRVVPAGARAAIRAAGRTWVVASDTAGELSLWDAKSRERLTTLALADSPLTAVALRADARQLGAGFLNGTIQLYNLPAEPELQKIEPRAADQTIAAYFGPVRLLAFSPGGDLIASSTTDATVTLRHTEDMSLAGELINGATSVTALSFAPGQSLLAVATQDGAVRLWDAATRTLCLTLPAEGRPLRALAFSPDAGMLAGGGTGPLVTMWYLTALRRQLAELGLDW